MFNNFFDYIVFLVILENTCRKSHLYIDVSQATNLSDQAEGMSTRKQEVTNLLNKNQTDKKIGKLIMIKSVLIFLWGGVFFLVSVPMNNHRLTLICNIPSCLRYKDISRHPGRQGNT